MDINQLRRTNLTLLIEEKYEGNRAAFCRATGKNPNLINLVLSSNAEYRRNIGEKLARSIEELVRLPANWLDELHPELDAKQLVAIPYINGEKGEVTLLSPAATQARFGRTKHLASIRVTEDSMSPLVAAGDVVFLDTSVTSVTGNGVYVLKSSGQLVLRRVQLTPPSSITLICDNAVYQPVTLTGKAAAAVEVVGRAIVVAKMSSI